MGLGETLSPNLIRYFSMAKINDLETHDIKGKILEKKGKIKDWGGYNKDLFKLTKEAAKEQGAIGKERRRREDEDLGAEIVDQAWFESGKIRSYSVVTVSAIDEKEFDKKIEDSDGRKCNYCDCTDTVSVLHLGYSLIVCEDHYLKYSNGDL